MFSVALFTACQADLLRSDVRSGNVSTFGRIKIYLTASGQILRVADMAKYAGKGGERVGLHFMKF
jgi:hypothetical protein